jgi:hypothetical protein
MRKNTYNTKYYLDKYKGVVKQACLHFHSQPASYPERYVFLARRHDNIPIIYRYLEKQRKYVIVLVGHEDKLFTVKLTKKEDAQRTETIMSEPMATGISKPNYHYIDIISGIVFPVWDKKLYRTYNSHPLICIGKFKYKDSRKWDVRFEGRKIMFRAEGKEHEKILTDEQNAMRIAHILTHPHMHLKQAI